MAKKAERHKVVMNFQPDGWAIQFSDPKDLFQFGTLEVAFWAMNQPDLELVGVKMPEVPEPKVSKAKFDAELSKKFSKKAKLKQCFDNCFQVMLDHDELANAEYVEGLAGTAPMAVHHAWIEFDGVVIDPTRHVIAKDHHNCDDWAYHAAVRLNRIECCRLFAENKHPAWDYEMWDAHRMLIQIIKNKPKIKAI